MASKVIARWSSRRGGSPTWKRHLPLARLELGEVTMEMIPWAFILFASLFNVVLIAVAVWFAWVLVSSMRGIHQELTRIRQHLVSPQDESRLGS